MAGNPRQRKAVTVRRSRRGAIALLGTGMLAAILAPLAAARASNGRLGPPSAPMKLRYTVRRPLSAEAEIVTERNFEIRFIALAAGYRVEGRQVSSAIDGPPELAPLAEVWRKTELAGLFPFTIDERGLIVTGSGPSSTTEPELGEAIDIALAMLRDGGASETQIADTRSFGRWLQQAAEQIGSDLPPNLFVPPAEPQQASRTIELPGGTAGTIEIRFEGTLSPETGLMREARREIVTWVEGTGQSMAESWSLTLA